jgi:hypothetical protein
LEKFSFEPKGLVDYELVKKIIDCSNCFEQSKNKYLLNSDLFNLTALNTKADILQHKTTNRDRLKKA